MKGKAIKAQTLYFVILKNKSIDSDNFTADIASYNWFLHKFVQNRPKIIKLTRFSFMIATNVSVKLVISSCHFPFCLVSSIVLSQRDHIAMVMLLNKKKCCNDGSNILILYLYWLKESILSDSVVNHAIFANLKMHFFRNRLKILPKESFENFWRSYSLFTDVICIMRVPVL